MKKYILLATTMLATGLLMTQEGLAQTNIAPQTQAQADMPLATQGSGPPSAQAENITTGAAMETGSPLKGEKDQSPRLVAQRFIQHVNYARVALAMQNGELAAKHVAQAQSMLALLKADSSDTRRISDVESGRVVYDDGATYSRYHYFPIEAGPMDVEEVDTGPFWAKNEGIGVTDADVVYVTIDLTDNTADKYLADASTAIGQQKFDAADKDLADLTGSVVQTEDKVALPIVKARDNIALAHDFILRRNYDGARYALSHADDALDEMQKDDRYKIDQPRIIVMRKEINDMQGDIEKKDPTMLQKASMTMTKWSRDLGQWVDQKTQ